MAHKPTADNRPKTTKPGREDRLKAALKANMARRKAQARARTQAATDDNVPTDQDQAEKSADV